MPFKTKGLEIEYNKSKIEASLLNPDFYIEFSDIKMHSQPRPNYFFVDNRRNLILNYIEFLLAHNNKEGAKNTYNKMKTLMPEKLSPLSKELEERCNKFISQFWIVSGITNTNV